MITLPNSTEQEALLTPKEIVRYLDRYIVGQKDAKKAVAIALRNRWRRKMVPPELAEDILPKNIIMIGPTGVGKTEIARRLAKLANQPFVKVEASKFTEVGYVGRDVDSMIRDLMETSVALVRREEEERVRTQAHKMAEEKLLDRLMMRPSFEEVLGGDPEDSPHRKKAKLKKLLRSGKLDNEEVELSLQEKGSMPMFEIFSASGMEEIGMNMRNMMGNLFPGQKKDKRLRVGDALDVLEQEEAANLVDNDAISEEARRRVEQTGIVFLDEIDKIAGRQGGGSSGPDVSREGVQRDLLPIIEGTTVATKYGPIKTDHILFIAAGAFHVAKPSELIPELQGRFPIRVELNSLGASDFRRILVEPDNSLIRQYTSLLATEGVELVYEESGIEAIADLAVKANDKMENIGARRLYTLMEKLLEDVSFEASDMAGSRVVFNDQEVRNRLVDIIEDQELSKYVL